MSGTFNFGGDADFKTPFKQESQNETMHENTHFLCATLNRLIAARLCRPRIPLMAILGGWMLLPAIRLLAPLLD